jgi:hypothetical protein
MVQSRSSRFCMHFKFAKVIRFNEKRHFTRCINIKSPLVYYASSWGVRTFNPELALWVLHHIPILSILFPF